VPAGDGTGVTTGSDSNPFLLYRRLLSPYRLARSVGLSDDAWAEIVGILDKKKLLGVDRRGFRVTPITSQPALAKALETRILIRSEKFAYKGIQKYGSVPASIRPYVNVTWTLCRPIRPNFRSKALERLSGERKMAGF
jgi:hypothetical protein